MSIHLSSVFPKHERRITLLFDAVLAAGAFTTLSYYTVSNLDGKGTSPAVVAAFHITGNTSSVELSLGADLVGGALYSVSAIGVPAQAGGTTDSSNILQFELPLDVNSIQNQEVSPLADAGLILYGRDILWNGTDLQEDHNGDLATVSGNQNVQQAVTRRLLSDGLPWKQSYGARPRQYVDGAAVGSLTLQGAIIQQALSDSRVKSASVDLIQDDSDTTITFRTSIKLIGDEVVDPIDTSVKIS